MCNARTLPIAVRRPAGTADGRRPILHRGAPAGRAHESRLHDRRDISRVLRGICRESRLAPRWRDERLGVARDRWRAALGRVLAPRGDASVGPRSALDARAAEPRPSPPRPDLPGGWPGPRADARTVRGGRGGVLAAGRTCPGDPSLGRRRRGGRLARLGRGPCVRSGEPAPADRPGADDALDRGPGGELAWSTWRAQELVLSHRSSIAGARSRSSQGTR